MREITILSGKGGTGKTGLTAAFASVASNVVFTDIDVDAPDLHLILQPGIREENVFPGARIAEIDNEQCTNCGLCKRECRFDAIEYKNGGGLEVNAFKCEACRLCERICPTRAIRSKSSKTNWWYSSDTRFGTLFHAKMGPGEENSGKLVTILRNQARIKCRELKADILLNDGPPGVGCTAISSITGNDKIILVTEPSKSGFHDAVRLIELVRKFNIPIYAVINKFDINLEITAQMESFFSNEKIVLLGRIPFNNDFVNAMVDGKSIVEYQPDSEISKMICEMWHKLTQPINVEL